MFQSFNHKTSSKEPLDTTVVFVCVKSFSNNPIFPNELLGAIWQQQVVVLSQPPQELQY